MAGIDSIRNIANIMAQKYGANPQFVAAQLAHESANGTSQLAVENHNYGGLTQSTPNGEENKQPDGSNYYRMFGSDEEYADAMYNDFFKYYPEILKAKTIDEYSHILKQNGYYGASETDYTNSLKGWLGKAGQNGGLLGGANPIDSVDGIKTNMVTENPNEKLDMEGVMAIIQQPKRNVAAAGEEALREQLVRQAHHKARGAFASRFYEDSDKAMMNAAVAKAQEEAKLQNANAQLTGAGKLAQMIANSQNNSNRQAYASLGAMVGMNVNPMQTQLMSHNELAKMGLQVQLQRKQLEEQMQRQKEMMLLSAATRPHGGGGGYGGGRRSSGDKRIMNPAQNTKYVDEIRNGFREVLENNANLDGFSQHDVDNLNEQAMLSLQKLAVAEDDPYAVQTVNDIKRWQAEQLKHMADSQSGHDLKYD